MLRRIKLLHVNLLLFAGAAAIVLLLAFTGKLVWAWNALGLYLDGQTTTPIEVQLEAEALSLLQVGGDADEIRELLQQTIAIDPHSRAVHLLGDLYLREGELERALEQYRRYLEINPSFLPTYFRLVEIYEQRGQTEQRAQVLQRGVDYFSRELELFRPHEDDDVHDVYNDKAAAVYNGYHESLRILTEKLGPNPS